MADITIKTSSDFVGYTADGVKVVMTGVVTDNGVTKSAPAMVNRLREFKDWTGSSTGFFVSCTSSAFTSGDSISFSMNTTSGTGIRNIIDVNASTAGTGAVGTYQILAFGV